MKYKEQLTQRDQKRCRKWRMSYIPDVVYMPDNITWQRWENPRDRQFRVVYGRLSYMPDTTVHTKAVIIPMCKNTSIGKILTFLQLLFVVNMAC